MKMIQVNDLYKCFSSGDSTVAAVNHISFEVEQGEFVSFVGKSGSGKSTLLHLLGGLLVPDGGQILVNDRNLAEMKKDELADYRSKNTGFIFQSFFLEPSYTVYENLKVALMIAGISKGERDERIKQALESVGLSEKIKTQAARLSGGERQRVAIARALVRSPQVILADEPCGNLDSENSEMIMNILKNLNEEGKTVLLVTHNPKDALCAKRVIEMKDGRIVRNDLT